MVPALLIGLIVSILALVAVTWRLRVVSRRADRVPAIERDAGEVRGRLAAAEDWSRHLVAALDAVPQGVVVLDVEGRVVVRNRAAREVEEARHGAALVAGAVEDLGAAARAGDGGTRTIELFGPPARVVEVIARPLPVGAMVVIDDVTEARRVDAVRRDFVANLSHELKTPVGAIGLLAETLLAETDPEVGQRLAQRVVDESFRVSRTIDDLMELTRIETGADAVGQQVSVRRVLEEAADRIRPAAELRDIAVWVSEVSPRVQAWGDRLQLTSAVANLLDNAVKYSGAGSSVEVRGGTDGAAVTIEVEDHGVGIPARDQERIFERFYRVDRARSRDTGGTGLGLAIVRHVVANHAGEVSVASVEGHGSTFTITIPAGPGPVAVSDPGSSGPVRSRRSA